MDSVVVKSENSSLPISTGTQQSVDTRWESAERGDNMKLEDELLSEEEPEDEDGLTNEESDNIMTNERGKRNVRNVQANIRAADQQPAGGHGAEFPERKQESGVSENVRGGQERIRQAESQTDQGARRKSDSGRRISEPGLEHSRESDTLRGEQRLAARIITEIPPTSKPKDIILDSNTDIGFNAGVAARFDANLAAIRTLKALDTEQRPAIPQEQAVLARYSGFGDSAYEEAFRKNAYKETPWTKRGEELRALCTDEEYQAIERSRINAFYTTPEVINAMWTALKHMGIDNVRPRKKLVPAPKMNIPKNKLGRTKTTKSKNVLPSIKVNKQYYTKMPGGQTAISRRPIKRNRKR